MLVIVGSFTLVVGMSQLSGSSFHDDRDTLVASLQKARSQAMNEVCLGSSCTEGLPHGVHITPHSLVIFQGAVYNSNDFTNEVIDAGSNATTFSGPDIVFAELSGDASPGTVTVTDTTGDTSTVTVQSEGQISWTN